MKKVEQLYRELLFQALEKKCFEFTQKQLAEKLEISLTNINHGLKVLKRMNAIKTNPQNFKIVNAKKILYYWACIRNLEKETVYSARVEKPVREIEKLMPSETVFTAYSGFKFKFKEVPADYSEVVVYSSNLKEIEKRFPKANSENANVFILQADGNLKKYGEIATIASIFVDLWNLPQWYARDFLKALEEKVNAILE